MAMNTANPNHLLIGLGGTGGKILKAFKKRLFLEYPDDKVRNSMTPAIAFLYVDSTREMMNDDHKDMSWRVMGKDATFTTSEFCNIRPQATSVAAILGSVDNFPGMKYIVKNAAAMKNTLGEIKTAAGQMRRAGRIMFASSASMYLGALSKKYEELTHITGLSSIHIHIFTGLAGGTGSGCIVDVVAQTRKKYPNATIDVYAMVPEKEVPGNLQAGRYHQNGYAALKELNAMNVCRWLPSDVVTGDEHIKFADPTALKQFSLILFSNVNTNGIVVPTILSQTSHGDQESELLHSLVADSLFFRLFTKDTPATNGFIRAWSCENLDKFQVEYDTKSKEEDKVRARTKAIATFGIKRIVFPEKRIMQHISYTISEKLIYQMRYNNFKEEGEGYVDEAPRRDYGEIIRDENNLRHWMLDDSHLTLNEKILETDKKTEKFSDFWDSITSFYTYEDSKRNGGNEPLNYLESYCLSNYNDDFRLKQGVEDYFKDKASDKPLAQQSNAIVDAIENHLYSGWYSGKFSMYDLIGYCETILEYIKKKEEGIDGEISKIDEDLEAIHNDMEANKAEYNHSSFLKILIGKLPHIYSEHQSLLSEYYTTKTERAAKTFEAKLLGKLRNDFEDFQQQMYDFLDKLLKDQKNLAKEIAERTRKDDKIDMHNIIVDVAKDSKMLNFEERLQADRTKMDSLATLLRQALVGECAFAHFGDLAKRITDNTIADIADEILTPQIVNYHNEDEKCKRDPIMGINVLEQVKKLIEADPNLDMGLFTQQIINQCGTFLELNDMELQKKLNNNPNPLTEPFSMNRRCVVVSMPDYTQNNELRSFGEEMENAFRSAFGVENQADTIDFDHSTTKKNEITVCQVRSCFPIRALECLPLFKSEYDNLVEDPNEVERKQNVILLHSEGDGTNLPRLEGEPDAPMGDNLVKYFFLAAAFGIIQEGQDAETEEDGWCVVTLDDWDNATLKCLSKRFTSLLQSEDLDNSIREDIVNKVEAKLNDSELKKSEREAAAEFIKKMMQTTVKDECSSTTSPLYKSQGNAAKTAIGMILKK